MSGHVWACYHCKIADGPFEDYGIEVQCRDASACRARRNDADAARKIAAEKGRQTRARNDGATEERALVVRFVRGLTADKLAADGFADRIDRGEHRQ